MGILIQLINKIRVSCGAFFLFLFFFSRGKKYERIVLTARGRCTHFPISLTATLVPSIDALYTFPKLPSPILSHSRLDDRSAGSKSGPSIVLYGFFYMRISATADVFFSPSDRVLSMGAKWKASFSRLRAARGDTRRKICPLLFMPDRRAHEADSPTPPAPWL